MKQLTILLVVFLMGTMTISAQTDTPTDKEKMQQQMKDMQENMKKMLEGMGGTFGFEIDTMMIQGFDQLDLSFLDKLSENGGILMDTTIIRNFEDFDGQEFEIDGENWGEDLSKIMEQLGGSMQQFDWSQMEDMMQQFGLGEGFMMPMPTPELDENGEPLKREDGTPLDKSSKKKKKKRKTYSL